MADCTENGSCAPSDAAKQLIKENVSARFDPKQGHPISIIQDVSGSGDNCVANIHIGDNFHYDCHLNPDLRLPQTDPVDELKKKLQRFYKKATLPRVSWLDEGEDFCLKNYYVELQLESSKTTIKLEEIFNAVDGNQPERIFIEGQPGFGKTSVTSKLIYDWANGEEYVSHFKLAFFIPLRELRGRKVSDTLIDIAEKCDFKDAKKTEKVIECNTAECLLILDGFDELSLESRLNVLKILYQQEFSEMTVVVTCRAGLFQPGRDELKQLSGGFSKQKQFYDKKISILGVEDVKEFLEKFCPGSYENEIVNYRRYVKNAAEICVSKEAENLLKSPLMLIMFAFMYTKGLKRRTEIETTSTGLYTKIVNNIVRYNISRNEDEDEDFDISCRTGECWKWETFIHQFALFGKVALKAILNNEYQMECDELTSEIYNFGFLVKHESKTRFESVSHFEPFHFTFLEFFAAFSIWRDFLPEKKFKNETLARVQELYLYTSGTSLVLPFLLGLLGNDANLFFQQMVQQSYKYSTNQICLWKLLVECEESEELAESVSSFLPPRIRSDLVGTPKHFFNCGLCSCVVKSGIKGGRIHQLDVKVFEYGIVHFPPENLQPLLRVDMKSDDFTQNLLTEYFFYLQKIQMRNHNVYLQFKIENFRDSHANSLNETLFRAFSIPLEKKLSWLSGSSVYSLISCEEPRENVKSVTIDSFRCVLQQNVFTTVNLLRNLLERNQIRQLNLVNFSFLPSIAEDISKILKCAAQSSELTCLQLDTELEVDIHQLTDNGKKRWNYLKIKGSRVKCSSPVEQQIHILHLLTDSIDSSALMSLAEAHVEVLECSVNIFKQLVEQKTNFTAPIISNLTQLKLNLDETCCNPQFWIDLMHFVHLEVLTIQFVQEVDIPVVQLVSCLKVVPIEKFEMRWANFAPNSVKQIAQQISSSLPWELGGQTHPLRTINFHFTNISQNLRVIVGPLVDCIQKGYLERVDVVSNESLYYFTSPLFNWVDLNIFCIEHGIHGSRESDPEFWKIKYNSMNLYEKLTISKRIENVE